MESVSRKEATQLLGVTENTVMALARRGKLMKNGPNQYDAESIKRYIAKRDSSRSQVSRTRANSGWDKHRLSTKQRILEQVHEHWRLYGGPPIYDWLTNRVGLAKSGIGRYIRELIDEEKLELYNYHVYLPGLRNAIMELVEKKF